MNKTDTNLCTLYSTEGDRINVINRHYVWGIRAAKCKGGKIKQSTEIRCVWVGDSEMKF